MSADTDALAAAAKIISDRAKAIASGFSSRIPAATHVTVSGGTVSVVTDGVDAPNAAPFEFAEMHPLWAHVGSWRYEHYKWGKQPHRPYMLEAAVEKLDDAAQVYGQRSMTAYCIAAGFKRV